MYIRAFVRGGICCGKGRRLRIEFDSDGCQLWDTRCQAQKACTCATPCFQDSFTRSGWNEGSHQNGFEAGSVTVAKLLIGNSTAQQSARSGFRKPGKRRSCAWDNLTVS